MSETPKHASYCGNASGPDPLCGGCGTSETPQEILDRAAPIWDKHVVSFTLVLAALRSVLAERDALREAHRKLGVLYQGTTQVVDALMDDVQSTGKLWHEAESRLEQARIDRDEAISQCVSIGRESKKLEAERDALRAEVAQAEGVARGYMLDAEKAEAALLDAQHQEALDIEALDKLGNAYDAAATAWGRDEAEYIRTVARLREAQHAAVVGWDKDRAEVERLRAEGLAIADGQIADRERLEGLLRRIVHGIDEWNSAVTPIIGRPVDYKWLALEEARAAVAPAEEGWGYDTETGEEGKS